MNSPARILAEYLIEENHFTHPKTGDDWPVFVSMMPDGSEPDICASIFDTAPEKMFRLITGEGSKWNWGIQIRFRTMTYEEGWNKAQSIASFLDSVTRGTVDIEQDTYTIDTFIVTSPVLSLGQEEKTERELFTLNGILWLLSS